MSHEPSNPFAEAREALVAKWAEKFDAGIRHNERLYARIAELEAREADLVEAVRVASTFVLNSTNREKMRALGESALRKHSPGRRWRARPVRCRGIDARPAPTEAAVSLCECGHEARVHGEYGCRPAAAGQLNCPCVARPVEVTLRAEHAKALAELKETQAALDEKCVALAECDTQREKALKAVRASREALIRFVRMVRGDPAARGCDDPHRRLRGGAEVTPEQRERFELEHGPFANFADAMWAKVDMLTAQLRERDRRIAKARRLCRGEWWQWGQVLEALAAPRKAKR